MYRRKIEEKLITWKTTPNHKPLIIKGVRQCGKTSSVRQFAIDNYESVIYMDFHEEKELRTIFDGSLNTNHLIMLISASIPDAHFIPGKTCLIFDEIQDCPGARASLKFWKQDGRYDVICTGSLLGVNGYKSDMSLSVDSSRDYSIPVGSELIIDMYPMDFEEWLWANKIPSDAIEQLYECLHQEVLVPEALHNRFRQLLLEYVVVGGMPEAVSTWLEDHDAAETRQVQRSILSTYNRDMGKHTKTEVTRIRMVWNSIPSQLAKDNKKFIYGAMKKGARANEFELAIQWLIDAGLIYKVNRVNSIKMPLKFYEDFSAFKLFVLDVGLMGAMVDVPASSILINDQIFSEYKVKFLPILGIFHQ